MKTALSVYRPAGGCYINTAICEAIALAVERQSSVTFDFNEIPVTVKADSDPIRIAAKFSGDQAAAARRYEQTPEFKRQKRREQARAKIDQQKVDALMKDLAGTVLRGETALIDWVRELALVADSIHVRFNHDLLSRTLSNAGYISNGACGLPKSEYSKRSVMGPYIIGQVLSCLDSGMPPHPVTVGFCETYAKLPSDT